MNSFSGRPSPNPLFLTLKALKVIGFFALPIPHCPFPSCWNYLSFPDLCKPSGQNLLLQLPIENARFSLCLNPLSIDFFDVVQDLRDTPPN